MLKIGKSITTSQSFSPKMIILSPVFFCFCMCVWCVCVCVSASVCIYVCSHVCGYIFVCMWRSKVGTGVLPRSFSTVFPEVETLK